MAGEDHDVIRAGATAWLRDHWDPDLRVREWWALLAESGWGFPSWPRERFGRGLRQEQAAAVRQAFQEVGAIGPPASLGQLLGGPTLLAHGSRELQERFMPELAYGRELWCQFFSEPGAGSDLAGLQTRAVRDGDGWVVNGQKVWTSGAQHADRGMLVARTDPDVPKHQGLTYFIIDLDQPGIEVRPLHQMNGAHGFNEVFFTDARVGGDRIVGQLNGGWAVAVTTLMYERFMSAMPSAQPGPRLGMLEARAGDVASGRVGGQREGAGSAPIAPAVIEVARALEREADPVVRQRLAALAALEEVNRLEGLRSAEVARAGQGPGAGGSVRKVDAGRPADSWRRAPAAPGAVQPGHLDRWGHRRDPAQHHRRARAGPAQGAPAGRRRPVPGPEDRHSDRSAVGGRRMELDLGPELRAFREEMRAWIAEHAPAGLTGPGHPAWPDWERRLLEARLVCPQWPEAAGGRGWDGARLAVFNEECHRAGAPRVTRGMGESLVGPSVIVHGTDEQRARLLPRIIEGRDLYCQGFSEPDHGSDLAGVETRGEVAGDELVVTGQKVWTSRADRADHIFVLCRTEPDAPRHHNLSYVLLPMRDNGIEIRPLRQMSGATGFFEVFLDRARAPLSSVIGGLGNGWRVAMTTLGFERGGRATVAHLAHEREFWELVETARRYGRDRDPLVRQQLAWAYAQVQVMRYQGMRLLAQLAAGRAGTQGPGEAGPVASVTKLFWSEYHRRLGEIAVDITGADALIRPDGEGYATGRWQDVFLSSRAGTIFSGTSEIQRNIIAERALGLPREPKAPARTEMEVAGGPARR